MKDEQVKLCAKVEKAARKSAGEMADFMEKFLPKGNEQLLITPATRAGAKTTQAIMKAVADISSDRK